MPVLWTRQAVSVGQAEWQAGGEPSQEWEPVPVTGPACGVQASGLCREHLHGDGTSATPARLVQGQPHWVLLAEPEAAVFVNGETLSLGIHVLRDHDEIAFREGDGLTRFYYSTEQLARVEPFPGAARQVICPRCKLPIEAGQPAVKCPSSACGLWHHEDTEQGLNCWSFAQHCATCDQPTPLDAGYRWTPAGL